MPTLLEKIRNELDKYKRVQLDSFPSFTPTQDQIIELIDLYWLSKYREGDRDYKGYKRPFYNIVENPTLVASKMIDFDTKDVQIIAEDGQSYYPAWFMGKELRIWMKEKRFGELLNQIVYNLPKYGHILLKKTFNGIDLVPLQNVINKPNIKDFLTSPLLAEKHEYTKDELRKKEWENIESVIFANKGLDKITIYEVLGEIEGEDNNYFIIADTKDKKGIILHQDKIEREDLYREIKWDDIPSRALGRGVTEKLFEEQISVNQIENLFRRGLRWTSKHVFQTRDETIANNLMTDVEDGDLMIVQSEITPIATEERNLHSYRYADDKWGFNIDRRTFAYDVIRGERTPAGTPLGSALLQTRMAGGFFDLKREDLGMFLESIIMDWIIPSFKKEKRIEHKFMLGEFRGEELDKIREMIVVRRTNKEILNTMLRAGRIPTSEQTEVIKATIRGFLEKEKEITIPKGIYENLKYKIKVIISAEQIDMAARIATLQTVLTIIGTNPTILQDPLTKKLFYQILDLAGISPIELEIEKPKPEIGEIMEQQVAKRGGGIARVPPVLTPRVTETPVEV